MNKGQKILLDSLLIFGVVSFAFLAFGFFVYPNFFVHEKAEVLPATEVLSVFDQQNPYAFECPDSFPVVHIPNDYPTIQEGIDSVNTGSVIKVAPGVYNEHIVLKSNVCLIGEEFGKVELQGFNDTVIVASGNNQIKNFLIKSLGRSEIGVLVSGAEGVNIHVNSFENFQNAILANEFSKISVNSNVFTNVDNAITLKESMFFVSQNNIEASNIALHSAFSEGEFLGQVINGGEYGVKAENSTIFFNANIFKNHSRAGMQLCENGEYEIGDNFFNNTNEEILY